MIHTFVLVGKAGEVRWSKTVRLGVIAALAMSAATTAAGRAPRALRGSRTPLVDPLLASLDVGSLHDI